ncbi:MAG TPA: SpoIID/LytB domain-containing protein [bacterium]|nr:SpoIID/LytB domain-containing protein [bacterium]HPN45544.1 SpoIID/LytB domain-containing protein [bacterium]
MPVKRIIIAGGLFISLSLFLSCAGVYFGPAIKEPGPVVRVGIMENKTEITFTPQNAFVIAGQNGKVFRVNDKDTWKAEVINGVPAVYSWKIVLLQTTNKEEAERALQEAQDGNLEVVLLTDGDVLSMGEKTLVDKRNYRLVLKTDYSDEQQARTLMQSQTDLNKARVVKLKTQDARGDIRLTNSKGKTITVPNVARMTGALITIRNVDVGEGFHFSRQEDRTYKGEMELVLGKSGQLYVVNVLTLEEYLEGVLPGEMPATFPLEALKAQTIAARTFFLYNFGRRFREEPFDVSDDVRSQAFIGAGKRDKQIEKAIRQTRGQVLMFNGKLCSTPYSAICGGHTELAQNAWEGEGEPYLQGVLDVVSSKSLPESFDLSREDNVRKWVTSNPKVSCNIEPFGSPGFAAYSTKYFRWEQKYTRAELEKIIADKTKHNIGTLLDIVPVKRGVSGRLIEVEVLGANDRFTVRKELNIRQAFSTSTLYSACFVVDKNNVTDGVAQEFVFRGAGWGHGVGMCQVGAAIMARERRKCGEILKHYYRGAQVQRYY